MFKKLISAALLIGATMFVAAPAFSQGTDPGTPEMVRQILKFRKFNNSGTNATLTVPLPLDSEYVVHLGARVDTTEWLMLFDKVPGFPNFSPATLAIDTAFVFRLSLELPTNAAARTGVASDSVAIGSRDSCNYSIQFCDNPSDPITNQNVTNNIAATIAGQGNIYSRNFFTLPTCTYKDNAFYGAKGVRFIITWPLSTRLSAISAVVSYNTNRLSRQY